MDFRDAYAGKKVLITGGLGFIGSNMAHRLVGIGADVTLVDSMVPDMGGNLFNIHWIEDRVKVNIADIRDEYSMAQLVQRQDYIFNLASQVSHIASMREPLNDLDLNCQGQLVLLEACRSNNRSVKIIYAGTRQVYGRPDYLPLDEKHPIRPVDVNGINKVAAEWYHLLYHQVYGMRTTSLRLTNTYGPRQLVKHDRSGFIGWFFRKAIVGEEIQIFGDGSQLRDYNFIEDVVDAFLVVGASEKANGQLFNLGDKPYSHLELVQTLLKVTGKGSFRLIPFPEERKRVDIGSVYSSFNKIRDNLGWSPRTSLEEGLAQTVEYFKSNRSHYWSQE